MFSLFNFYDLIEFLFTPDKERWEALFSEEYVEVQSIDSYSGKSFAPRMVKGELCFNNLMGYRGVRTKNELFIRRNDGKETYSVLSGGVEFSSEQEKIKRIAYLREKAGTYIIDIYKNDFFEFTRCAYQAIENSKMRMERTLAICTEIINREMRKIPSDAVVAVRGGGEHTKKLFEIIKDDKRVSFIVDKEDGENWAKQTIKPDEMDNQLIDVVLISSFKYRNEMKKELQDRKNKYEVIDFYDIFEMEGLELRQPFYGIEQIEPCDCENIDLEKYGVKKNSKRY